MIEFECSCCGRKIVKHRCYSSRHNKHSNQIMISPYQYYICSGCRNAISFLSAESSKSI